MKKRNNTIRRNQQGLVSIVVTLVFVSIISVVVLSFAFLIRREQQQALDRQLSTQAFYAAESGVSDAVANIGSIGDVNTCTEQPLGTGSNVSISCVLIDQSPATLEYGEIATDRSEMIRLFSNGTEIDKVEIHWEAADSTKRGVFAENNQYYLPTQDYAPSASNNFSEYTGLLRTEFIPLFNGVNNVTRSDMSTNVITYFLYPADQTNTATLASVGNGSSVAYDSSNNNDGAFIAGDCGNPANGLRDCKTTITNVRRSGSSADVIYLRLKAAYQPLAVTILAFDTSGDQIDLYGQQAVVDSTGKAGGVLRRIQVRVPLRPQYEFPEFALETGDDICKRLAVLPSTVQDECPAP